MSLHKIFGIRPELTPFEREECQHTKLCLDEDETFLICKDCDTVWNVNWDTGFFEIEKEAKDDEVL